jgi:IMP dehydrogenase
MARYVREIMTKNLSTLEPDDSVATARQLMLNKGIHGVLIPPPRGGRSWRIFTSTDLLIALASGEDPKSIPIAIYASPATKVARADWSVERALDEMISAGVKHLPVMDEHGSIVGMLASADIVKHY